MEVLADDYFEWRMENAIGTASFEISLLGCPKQRWEL
jgi:hypothetical protein